MKESEVYLEENPKFVPELKPASWCKGAEAEIKQRLVKEPSVHPEIADLIKNRVYAFFPSPSSAMHFKQAFHGFITGARCTTPFNKADAEKSVVAERAELLAHLKRLEPLDVSLPARKVCISLAVPSLCIKSPTMLHLLEGLFAWSVASCNSKDCNNDDSKEVPVATQARFSAYIGESSDAIMKVVEKEGFGRGVDSIGIVLRWAEHGEWDERVRSEFARITNVNSPENAHKIIQETVNDLARRHGVQLPGCLYATINLTVPVVGSYQKVLQKTSNDFKNLVETETEFKADAGSLGTETHLVMVPNVFLRISPVSQGLEGVVSDSVMHAHLLCARGCTEEAQKFVREYRKGLPTCPNMPEYPSKMCLHACGANIDEIHLGGMVSLYGQEGIPGQYISQPGTRLFRSTTAIIPLSAFSMNWFVHSCSIKSTFPEPECLRPGTQPHLQRGINLFQRTVFCTSPTVGTDDDTEMGPGPTTPISCNGEDSDSFYLVALGIDFRSKKSSLGDVIQFLMTAKAVPQTLIDMLINVSVKVGLSSSLEDTFSRCTKSLEQEDCANKTHERECARLKRVADAALLISCKRRAVECAAANAERVKFALKIHSLSVGNKIKVDAGATMEASSENIANLVYECYNRRPLLHDACTAWPHREEIIGIVANHDDIVAGVAKALCTCMVGPGRAIDAFLLVRGDDPENVYVYRAQHGRADPSTIGAIVDAKKPSIMLIRRSNAVMLTALFEKVDCQN